MRPVAWTQVVIVMTLASLLAVSLITGHHETDPVTARNEASMASFRSLPTTDPRCPTRGPRAGRLSALVRTPAGRLHSVRFVVGWSVFTGTRPGTLVAICPADG